MMQSSRSAAHVIVSMLWSGLLALSALMVAVPTLADAQRMSIIIDDVGNNRTLGEAAIGLPGNLTISVLPGLSHSKELAELAHEHGRQVMLHMPMANHSRLPLGPMGLKDGMTAEEWRSTLTAAFESVPHAAGLNNHTGSLLTEREDAMAVVMEALRTRGAYFIDSLTSPNSVAYDIAVAMDVPAMKRHVFLDHEPTDAFISSQFSQAMRIMEQHGHVVVIGHPYPETLEFLAWVLPQLEAAGIELVSPDQLIDRTETPVPTEDIVGTQ